MLLYDVIKLISNEGVRGMDLRFIYHCACCTIVTVLIELVIGTNSLIFSLHYIDSIGDLLR